jgi:CheY-like chemotaxis protein
MKGVIDKPRASKTHGWLSAPARDAANADPRDASLPVWGAPRTVLLVEDDQDTSEVLGDLLQIHGYRVARVANGAEALVYLGNRRNGPAPCLILLDLLMPTMDGTEFLVRRSLLPEVKQIPVVVMTAASNPRERLRECPPESVLRKPFDLDVLLARVRYFSGHLPQAHA